MIKDYYRCVSATKEFSKIPLPPKVTQQPQHSVHKLLYETYRFENEDSDNPYRLLEKCSEFGIMHDATIHWVKQLNTVMLRVVTSELDVVKVPFSFKSVPSLTREALCAEIIENVSSIKKVHGNAFENIIGKLESQDENEVNLKYRSLKEGLKVAAEKVDLDALNSIQEEIKILLENNTGLEESGGGVGQASTKGTHDTGHNIYPKPSYFKLATIKNANTEEKVIHLEVQSENVPTCQCGVAVPQTLRLLTLLVKRYA